ncbi:MAG: GNAT family N-acetyltransferase [Syntrophomonadaceae bacterium]
MRIREASVTDAPAIAKVTVDTWKTAYRRIINDNYLNNLSYEEREKGWKQFPFDDCFVYVAVDEAQKILGFAAAGPEREGNLAYQGELYAIYVCQEDQNKGTGSALFLTVLQKKWRKPVSILYCFGFWQTVPTGGSTRSMADNPWAPNFLKWKGSSIK